MYILFSSLTSLRFSETSALVRTYLHLRRLGDIHDTRTYPILVHRRVVYIILVHRRVAMNGSGSYKNGRQPPTCLATGWCMSIAYSSKNLLFQFVSFRSYLPTGLQSTSDFYLNPCCWPRSRTCYIYSTCM
jgi:hypothetical protein